MPAPHLDTAGTHGYQHIFLTPDAVGAIPGMGAGEGMIHGAVMEPLITSLKAVILAHEDKY